LNLNKIFLFFYFFVHLLKKIMNRLSLIQNKEPWEEPQVLELSVKSSQLNGYTADDGSAAPSVSQ